MIEKICIVCNKKFKVRAYRKDTARSCSVQCRYKDPIRNRKLSDNNKRKGIKPIPRKGKDAWNWAGEKVTHSPLHKWIRKHKELPIPCEHCGATNRRLQWANKDHSYSRNLDDYIALCSPCHYKYDVKYNGRRQPWK